MNTIIKLAKKVFAPVMFAVMLMPFMAFGQQYTVTVTPSNAGYGTVSGGGTYESGATATLTAYPNDGYEFAGWRVGSMVRNRNNPWTFTVTGNVTYNAYFRPQTQRYNVNAVVLPENVEAGTVTGTGLLPEGNATLTAEETNPNYLFGGWYLSRSDAENSTNQHSADYSITLTVSSDTTVYAKYIYQVQQRNVSVVASPAAGGTVTGGGMVYEESPMTLTATANTGYQFVNWTLNGEVVSTDATYSFFLPQMASDPTYVANFTDPAASYTVTLTRNISEGGTVNFTSQTYLSGSSATVVAYPANSYSFVGWVEGTDTVSRSTSYTFDVSNDRTLQAFFRYVPPTYTVSASASPDAGGNITGTGDYTEGSTATLSATANTGFSFVNWTEGGQQVSTNANYSFSVTGNRTLVANFVQTYAITAVAGEGGSVSGSGTYNNGATATVTATANNDYAFSNWTENGQVVSSNESYSFTVNGARTLTANFLPKYDVALSVSPSAAAGSVSGAGNFTSGTSVSVSASAATGYHFVEWQEGGVGVSSSNPFVFTIDRTRNLTAVFELNTYAVTATSSPLGAGSVSGTGNKQHGSTVTLTATAEDGFEFSQWRENGMLVSTENPYVFTATEAHNFEVVFNTVVATYTVSTSCDPATGGTVTRSANGPYNAGTQLTLTANPNTTNYYTFANWTKNGVVVSTNAAYTFEVNENQTLVAHFNYEPPTVTINATASPANAGTFIGTGTHTTGESVTLTAEAAENYVFYRWMEDGRQVSVANPYTFTADANNHSFVAEFNYVAPTITVTTQSSPVAGGSVTGGGNTTAGSTVTLRANANTNYNFVRWTVNNVQVSTSNPYSFVANESMTVTAVFEYQAPNYTIGVNNNPAAGGHVEGLGNGTFAEGTQVTLTAVPNNDYVFTSWTENGTVVCSDAAYTFTVNGNRSLQANYTYSPQSYTISATCDPAGSGSVSGTGNYAVGTLARLTATANNSYQFVDWTEGGVVVSTNPIYAFTVSGSRQLVAHFERQNGNYTVSAIATPDGGGVVTGAGEYAEGTQVTLTASPNSNYTFTGWYEGSSLIATSNTYSFVINSDRTFYAVFEYQADQYTVNATVSPEGVGVVSGTGTYDEGTYVTLRAVSTNNNYTFLNWTENGHIVSPNATYSFIALGNRNLVANFYAESGEQYTITLATNNAAAGTVSGAGVYNEGEAVTITATPAANFYFAGWSENGNIISTATSYTFIANANRRIVGNFECYCHTQVELSAGEGTITDGSGSDNYLTNTNCSWLIRPAGAETVTLNFTSFSTVLNMDYVDIYDGSTTAATRIGHFSGHTIPASVTSTNGVMLVRFTTNGTRTDAGWEANYTSTYGEDSYLIYRDDTKTVVVGCNPNVTSVHVPGRVRKIASRAFEGCNDMVRISIPASIDTIEDHAFYYCTKLEKVNLPSSVRYLGSYAFAGCSSLEQVTLPSALDTIRNSTFEQCSALKRIELPTTVKRIGSRAFYNCSNVYSLIVPASVDTVESYAFAYMTGLRFVTLNAGNKHFASNAFYSNYWQNSIQLTNFIGDIADWMNITWGNEYAQPMRQSRNFAINGQIVNDLVVPEGTDVVNGFAFYNNEHINTLTLPSTLDSIGPNAFYNLSGLERIVLNGPQAKVNNNSFAGVSNTIPVVVPCESLDSIRTAGWSIFTRFVGEGVPILTIMQRKGGLAKITTEPTCDNFTAVVEALPGSSYDFVSWSDGSTDNPHTITLYDDDVIAPVFQRKVMDPIRNHFFSFETEQDLADWYNGENNSDDNMWYVGNTVSYEGDKALYLSNDGGVNNTYNNSYNWSNTSYVYTDLYLRDGVYDFSLQWLAQGYGDDEFEDNLRIALIPDDVNMSPDADGAIPLGAKLNGQSSWQNFERTAQISTQGWYKLVFFWNYNYYGVNNPAPAIDNIYLEYKEDWRLSRMYWAVNVMSSDDNAGSVSGGGVYAYTDIVTIEAMPNSHYMFTHWNDGNTDNPRQVVMSEYYGNDEPFVAYFREAPYQVVVDITDTRAANVIGNGYFESGERDTIAVVYPQAGWSFFGWIDENEGSGDVTIFDNPYYITVNSDVHLTAVMSEVDTVYVHDTVYITVPSRGSSRGENGETEPEVEVLNEAVNARVYLEGGQIVVEDAGKYVVSLYDVNGRLLASKQDEFAPLRFDVHTSGTYMLRIGNYYTRKLVVIK